MAIPASPPVIPLYPTNVPAPANYMQIVNDLINQINAANRLLFNDIPGIGQNVPMWAMRKALGANFSTVNLAISGDPTNPIAIAWTTGAPVAPGDLLAAKIQTALNYSAAQMTALFQSAAAQTL